MTRHTPSPTQEWTQFTKKAMGFVSAKSSAMTVVVALMVCVGLAGLRPRIHMDLIVFGFFATLSVAYLLTALTHVWNWPAQAMFVWAQGPRPNWDPADDTNELASRVTEAIAHARDDESWRETRTLAEQLPADIRRVHALAMIDVFHLARFDEVAYSAAVGEVKDEVESRYWRAFAEFLTGGDYLEPLLEASKELGPFSLDLPSRVRIWIARGGISAVFMGVGIVAGVVLALARGA